jgi:aminoglycoside phosphotransferase (APT) family kinase protein
MSDTREVFEQKLRAVLEQRIDFYKGLNSADRLSGGASQETYRISIKTDQGDRILAMRRAPGGMFTEPMPGYPGLATEALLMQSAKAAGVPEPEVYWVLTPEDELGGGFIMQWIEGEALGARINRSEEFADIRPKLAYECGQIMARIHAIDLEETGLNKHLAEIAPAEFVEQTKTRYEALNTPQPMIDYAARWLTDHLPRDYAPVLVHNDFRNGNFMLTPDGISAVLDWEIAHIGDPMRDLGWICTNSWRFGGASPVGGFGEYQDLFAGYESITGKPVDPEHVKFWEVFGSFWWAVGCLGMAEHYRTGPDKTVERPAIGRRSSECQVDCVNLIFPGPVELVPESPVVELDMPRADELLSSVRDFLRTDVMSSTKGRTNFMARVASNSLDIVLRELSLGQEHRRRELVRLQEIFNSTEGLENLRWRLVNELRDQTMPLDSDQLQAHLRATVVNQIAIDQPKYSGFKTATAK